MTYYALITNPRCELRAKAGLDALGIETYLPVGRKWSKPRHATSVVMRMRPAYPRYLFIAFPGYDTWQGLPRIDGVSRVVGSTACGPYPIPDSQIDRVRALEAAGDLNFNREPKTWLGGEYAIGELLRLTEGPFAGFTGTVVRSSTKRGVDLELMLFGRTTVTTAKIDDVRRAA